MGAVWEEQCGRSSVGGAVWEEQCGRMQSRSRRGERSSAEGAGSWNNHPRMSSANRASKFSTLDIGECINPPI